MSRGVTRQALIRKIASVLLGYPDEGVYRALDDVAATLPALGGAGRMLDATAAWLRATPPGQAAEHYVTTFDLTRRCPLYLTYYRDGDTRRRGMALLALKQAYRQAGFTPPPRELPDYLPLVLEFAALAPDPGERLLRAHRAALELLRDGLHAAASPYAHALDAVCAGLPGLAARQREMVRRFAAEGPPTETVGIEPFAPPDYLAGGLR